MAVWMMVLAVMPAHAQAPDAVPQAPAVATPAGETGGPQGAQAATATPPPQAAEDKDSQQSYDYQSIFFTKSQVNAIHAAIRSYIAKNGTTDAATAAAATSEDLLVSPVAVPGSSPAQRLYTYPQFFLESLIYRSPKDWSVRINGNKITQDATDAMAGIEVLKIDHDKVTLKWRPDDMARVQESLRRSPSTEVEFDPLAGSVVFTLHPNQTFSSYAMKVLEGKVLPVEVEAGYAGMPSAAANDADIRAQCEKQVIEQADNAPPEQKKLLLDGCMEMMQKTEDGMVDMTGKMIGAIGDKMEKPDGNNEGLGGLLNAYDRIGKTHSPVVRPAP